MTSNQPHDSKSSASADGSLPTQDLSGSDVASLGAAPSEEVIFRLLSRIGAALDVSVERSNVLVRDHLVEGVSLDDLHWLKASALQSGIYLKEVTFESLSEAIGFLQDGAVLLRGPIPPSADRGIGTADVHAGKTPEFVVVESFVGRRVETSTTGEHVTMHAMSRRKLKRLLFSGDDARWFVVMKEFQCDAFSSSPLHGSHDHHEHFSPLQRFVGLLKLERRDIWTVILFAFVAGILTLATPLAVESLVNVVSWGTYLQPLVILGLMLLVCLGLAGILRVLQTVVVEMIQRRQFVRIVSDLAHRFPRANQASLTSEYPRELANRVFDIMTIQKATAILLLDGVSIVLTTVIGLLLLAFYHPLLLGFDIVLMISMVTITWVLGRGGISTAIEESITKYRVAHWLQDVLAYPSVFKIGGGESLAIQRANQLTANYINARQRQFGVVIRQVAFAISLQAIASTVLLALGGWLVIERELTLGQLVASELVVTVVVGAFAKAGKSLEKFYDLMAGVDKVGHLIDIPADARYELGSVADEPIGMAWGDLTFSRAATTTKIGPASIQAGSKTAIVGDDHDGRRDLARALVGLLKPTQGLVQVAGFDSLHAAGGRGGGLVGYAGDLDVFHGTIRFSWHDPREH